MASYGNVVETGVCVCGGGDWSQTQGIEVSSIW